MILRFLAWGDFYSLNSVVLSPSVFSIISVLTLFIVGGVPSFKMSIDRDTFENTTEDELKDLSVPNQVSGFSLLTTIVRSRRETASQVGLDEGAVSTALSRLKDRGLVEHRATY
jgi:hypothetical protein